MVVVNFLDLFKERGVRLLVVGLIAGSLSLLFVFLPTLVRAATVTWDGGGADGTCGGVAGDGNKWSCGLNWSTDSVPGSADTAYFDATSTKDATIDAAQTITTLTMTTGYTGTITQAADLTITSNFTHDSTGGTYTGSSGTLTFSGSTGTWNVDTGDDTFGHVTINKTSQLTITSGDTAIVTGTLTLTNGITQSGTLEARGDISHGAGYDGGSGALNITQGSSDINLTAGGQLPITTLSANRTVNGNASGTVTFDGLFTMSAGAFVGGAGDLTLSGGLALSNTASFTAPSGTMSLTSTYTRADTTTVNYNSGIVLITGTTSIDLSETETMSSLSIGASFSIPSGETVVVPGTLTLTNSNIVVGTVEAQGDIVHTAGFDGGTGTLNITAGSSDITLVGGGQLPRTTLSVDREIIGPSSGQVIFDNLFTLSSGTYTGGAGNLWFLQGLTVSGGAFAGGSGTIDVQTTLTLSGSASMTSTSGTMTIGANWVHTDSSTFTHNSGTVTFDGSTQSIDVNATETFNNLNFTVAGTKTLGSGDTLVTVGTLTLSDGTINTGTLQPQGGVVVGAAYDGGTTAMTFSSSGTQSFDLTGATGGYNGDINVSKAGGQVNLVSALVMDAAGQDLTIQEGKLSLGGQSLTVNGTGSVFVVEDGGNFQLQGAETITLNASNPSLNSGSTVTYTGDGDSAADTYTVTTLEDAYHHLVLNSTDGATDVFQPGAALDLGGDLTLTAGTLDVVSGSNYALTVGGNWSNAGTFTPRAGTVTLDGTNQSVTGTTTFYNLTKTVSSAATLTLPAGATTTISNALTLGGAGGARLSLRSSSSGTRTFLAAPGTNTVSYLDVQDNEVSVSTSCLLGCTNSGNNVNWVFARAGGTIAFPVANSLEITSFAEAEELTAGETKGIEWAATGSVGYVNIYLAYDDVEFELIAGRVLDTGKYVWRVPSLDTDDAVIRVALFDLASDSAYADTPSFAISPASGIADSPDWDADEDNAELLELAEAGEYIVSESSSTVYYIDEGLERRPFMDAQTYFTYLDSFEPVRRVTDQVMGALTIGPPMLPRPGSVLIKIISDPRVYLPVQGEDGGVELRWIATEEIATAMLGQAWTDYVIDLPPTLWSGFTHGHAITEAFPINSGNFVTRVELNT